MAYLTYLSDSASATVTQGFGGVHTGVDIQFQPIRWSNICFPVASNVRIAANGAEGLEWSYGLHYECVIDSTRKYRLAHLNSLAVAAGADVSPGQFAGIQGNTGNVSGVTGIHLHIEYFINGVRSDPSPLMGFPAKVGTYQLEFGGGSLPPPKSWEWGELPKRKPIQREFSFTGTQAQEDTPVNTVGGVVLVRAGEWIVQPQEGKMIYRGVTVPNKTAVLEIPEIIITGGEEDAI